MKLTVTHYVGFTCCIVPAAAAAAATTGLRSDVVYTGVHFLCESKSMELNMNHIELDSIFKKCIVIHMILCIICTFRGGLY